MNTLDMRNVSARKVACAMVGLALLLAIQPVFNGLHHSREEHHWCPEHRTLEHSPGAAHGADAHWLPGRDGARLSVRRLVDSSHAECTCQQLLSERFSSSGCRYRTRLELPGVDAADRPRSELPLGQISRLALAPKQSPPA